VNDTVSNAARTKKVPGKHDDSSVTKGQTIDKRWFLMMLATNADRKSPELATTVKMEWQSFWKRTSCHVSKSQPDIRYSSERTGCDKQVDDKTGDGTDWRSLAPIPRRGKFDDISPSHCRDYLH